MLLVNSVLANDVEGDFSNNYQDSTVDSNNSEESTTNNYNAPTDPPDHSCNRRKNARLIGAPQQVGGLGLQVSGISILCDDPAVFKAMVLANTPCPVNDFSTGKLLMGKSALLKYRENPSVFVVGYKDNKLFWDTLLKVGEELESNEESNQEDATSKLSLSDRFRTSKRTDR